MKKILIVASLLMSGCVYDPSLAQNHRVGGMENSGVGVAYGIGASYNRPQGVGRESTKEELEYLRANQVDFAAVQRANNESNAESIAKEKESLKQRSQISCEDAAAIGYQVLVNKAWQSGDWDSVKSYNTNNVIARCHANRGQ